MFPNPNYCKQYWNEYWGSSIFLNYGFLRVYAQQQESTNQAYICRAEGVSHAKGISHIEKKGCNGVFPPMQNDQAINAPLGIRNVLPYTYIYIYIAILLFWLLNHVQIFSDPMDLWLIRLLCPWDFTDQNNGVVCHIYI